MARPLRPSQDWFSFGGLADDGVDIGFSRASSLTDAVISENDLSFPVPRADDVTAGQAADGDGWTWSSSAEDTYGEVIRTGNTGLVEALATMRAFLGNSDLMAYLSMMSMLLLELRRVLKPGESLHVHCHPSANHFAKVLADAAFAGSGAKVLLRCSSLVQE